MKFLLTFLTLYLAIGFSSCKTNKTINHHREGKWIYKDSVNDVLYKSKGRYKKGCEIKTWKYFENGKLVKIEKYNNSICIVKTFDTKRRLTSVGQSILVEDKEETHWYLDGNWTFFDDKGKVIGIKKYLKGELISENKI